MARAPPPRREELPVRPRLHGQVVALGQASLLLWGKTRFLSKQGSTTCFLVLCPSGLRERSAKPFFVGSNPTRTSTLASASASYEVLEE